MKQRGKPISTADKEVVLRTSALISRGYNGASGGLQTQICPKGEEWRTASVTINANGDVVIGCLKNFIFRKRANGGYSVTIHKEKPLSVMSNEVLSDMVAQFHEMSKLRK